MDLEKLNTTQIVLLVLLVSFVTSIATGIVTVTLMDQAPPAITQTINRVVERTVEKVVPEKSQGAAVVRTVIVKEESLIADAVQNNSRNVVDIFILENTVAPKDDNSDKKVELSLGEFVGLGFVISNDGMLIADSALVSNSGAYAIKMNNGAIYTVSIYAQDETKGVALLTVDIKDGNKIEFSAPPLADSDKTKLGQSVISINKKNELSVLTGIISRLQNGQRELNTEDKNITDEKTGADSENNADKEPKLESYLVSIYTTLNLPQSGSILLDTDGNIIGMNILREGISYAVPSNIIKELILSSQKAHVEQASSSEAQG